MPRPAKREYAWERLTSGDHLFCALREAVQSGLVDQAAAWLNTWQPVIEHQDMLRQRQWENIRRLLVCTHLAALNRETAALLPHWLGELDSTLELPAESECCAAAANAAEWRQFLRTQINRVAWFPSLNAAWAWDAVTALMDTPRPMARSECIGVLLVSGGGVIAQLTLELLADEGNSLLYPDPITMACVVREPNFQEAEQNAVAYIHAQGLWRETPPVDVCWKLTRQDGKPLAHLEGGSAGGAFALGLAKLFAV